MQILPATADFVARKSGGTEFEHGDLAEPADQHLLRLLVPALPARPLRRQRGRRGRRLQRRPHARGPLGRQPSSTSRTSASRRPRSTRARCWTSATSTRTATGGARTLNRCGSNLRPMPPFKFNPVYSPVADQPQAIAKLAEGIERGQPLPDAARRDRLGQDGDDGLRDREGPEADARARPQQDARGAALQRVPRVLPRQRGRVLRLLLRLLPARGLRPAAGPLHREGLLDQRRDRPPAALGDRGAVRARGRDHRRLGLGDLRHRLARPLQGEDAAAEDGRVDRPRRDAAPARLDAVHPQRPEPRARHLPGARRGARGASGLRRERLPRAAVRRRDRAHPALRPAHRRDPPRARPRLGLAGDPLRDRRRHHRALAARDAARAERALQLARGARQGARGAPPAPAHRVRHGDAEGDGLLLGDRELLADPRRPPGRARRRTR